MNFIKCLEPWIHHHNQHTEIPKSGVTESYGKYMFYFMKSYPSFYFMKSYPQFSPVVLSFCIPTKNIGEFQLPCFLENICFHNFLVFLCPFHLLNICTVVSHCGFDLESLINNDGGYLFMAIYVHKTLCPWDLPGKNIGMVAISFSRGSSWPRDQTWVSCLSGGFFISELPGKPNITFDYVQFAIFLLDCVFWYLI